MNTRRTTAIPYRRGRRRRRRRRRRRKRRRRKRRVNEEDEQEEEEDDWKKKAKKFLDVLLPGHRGLYHMRFSVLPILSRRGVPRPVGELEAENHQPRLVRILRESLDAADRPLHQPVVRVPIRRVRRIPRAKLIEQVLPAVRLSRLLVVEDDGTVAGGAVSRPNATSDLVQVDVDTIPFCPALLFSALCSDTTPVVDLPAAKRVVAVPAEDTANVDERAHDRALMPGRHVWAFVPVRIRVLFACPLDVFEVRGDAVPLGEPRRRAHLAVAVRVRKKQAHVREAVEVGRLDERMSIFGPHAPQGADPRVQVIENDLEHAWALAA